ncbi:PREDICTED: LOW QUALITY PROTEIN: Gilles de la Tourette syndrome chromosomal region candidate gene 1 protein [Rhinopithecus bieti]|uniref:LOW QUALITY PROTEIN: Gilles de la Tourette syndrome chromosomal region candidate gene 1 protein n=1 Tax=Rhinopithecus bieti TaxID=61621 RepID=UPI00083BD380|nr:PREDICTED: LOW QUALITY PROTEIN: Gilles de la Tourette syndrome chromosomal region candidate gene 1 protein [Rhinopithecus bieti]
MQSDIYHPGHSFPNWVLCWVHPCGHEGHLREAAEIRKTHQHRGLQIRGGRGRSENTEIFQVASVTGGEEQSLPAICMFLFLLCIAPIYACVCRIFKIQVRNTVRNSSTASLAPSISTNEERQIRIERHPYRLYCQ